jgi:quinol monooxygenase YgiN
MVIVAGEIRMHAGTRHEFLTAVAPLVAATLLEDGCHTYAFTPDPDDADLIRLYELWEDDASLAAHLASAHIGEWATTSATLPIVSADVMKYTVTDAAPLR